MNQKTLIWIGVGVAAILAYRYMTKKEDVVMTKEDMSNASGGTFCRCGNGFEGWCKSGSCTTCCGSLGVAATKR